MTVPFGFSVGDFVAGIGLVQDVIEALRASSTSTARYQGLMSELFTLERALLEVKKLDLGDEQASRQERLDIEALHGALRLAATQCQDTISRLLNKVKKYEGHLSANGSGSKWKDALRKVQWALLTDRDLEEYRAEIRGHSTSITMLLTLTQLQAMKLQSQASRNDRMMTIRWLQNGYTSTMSNLTGALTGIGRNLQDLLQTARVLVRLDYEIFQKVLQIQQNISPPLRYPEYGEPILFVDAFGKETRFYPDFVYSIITLEDWLKRRFEKSGYEKILKREYALEDMKTKRQINFSRDWQTQLYPGMHLGMDMIYKRHEDQLNTCPGCRCECIGTMEESIECPNCGVRFQRIDELLEFEEDTDGFTNTKRAAATVTELPQYDQQNPEIEPTNFSSTEKRRIQLFLQRMHREREQMRLFRRFRFQPTRMESELAMMPPMLIWTIRDSPKREDTKTSVEYEAAEEIYCQMLQRYEGNHNARQLDILCGLQNLGVVLSIYGKLGEAEKLFARILDEIRGSLRHEDVIALSQTLNNLSRVKAMQDKYQEEETLLRQALRRQEDVGGLENWLSICMCSNLAINLSFRNKVSEARNLLERAVKTFSCLYDTKDPDFSKLQNNLKYIQGL